MRILLFGASGVIGRPLARRLVAAGHEVHAATRAAGNLDALRGLGAEPCTCDAMDAAAVRATALAVRPEAIIHELTAIPPRIDPRKVARDLEPTNRLRAIATGHLVDAAVAAGCRRFIAQSIAFAYQPDERDGGRLRVEEDPLHLDCPKPYRGLIEAVAKLEERTTRTEGIEGTALRYGFFYGPRTVYAPDGAFSQDVARRRVPLMGSGRGVFSFIHVEDAAEATVLALDRPPGIYNVVDDDPAPVATWLPYLAEVRGAPRPFRVPRWLGRLGGGPYADYLMVQLPGASNAKAKRDLGWQPARPSWREGFREA